MPDELSSANGDTAVLSLPRRSESFIARWLWSYMYSGYCCSIKLQDPQQLVNFSLKFSYVA